MSGVRLLITGGAGFIGSAIVDAALARGYEVRVLDSLRADVHGPAAESTTVPGPGPERGPMIQHGPGFRARARSDFSSPGQGHPLNAKVPPAEAGRHQIKRLG